MSDIMPQDDPHVEQVIITDLDTGQKTLGRSSRRACMRLSRSILQSTLLRWARPCIFLLVSLLVASILFQPPAFSSRTASSSDIITISSSDTQPPIVAMSVYNGIAYVATQDDAIAAYGGNDGTLLWRQNEGGYIADLKATGQAIYCLVLQNGYGHVTALYPGSGMTAWKQQAAVEGATQMYLAGGNIYLHSGQGLLFAVSSDDGHILWSHPTLGGLPPAQFVSAENGYVSLPSPQADIDILRASDGKLVYHYTPSSLATSFSPYPTIQAGIIFISDQHSIEARSVNNGTLLWKYSYTATSWFPVIQDGIVFARGAHNTLLALRGQDGKLLWQYTTNPVVISPLITNATVYLQLPGNQVVALRESDGTTLWRAKLPSAAGSEPSAYNFLYPPVIDNGIIYVNLSLPGKIVYALLTGDGEVLWHHELRDTDFSPLTGDGVIVLNRDNYTIDTYSETNGQPLWSFQSTAQLIWFPVVENGLLFVQATDHSLLVLRLSDGKHLWRYEANG